MKFVTFNIRYDTPRDGINAFPHRVGMILQKIESERPDVVCFQECRPHVFDFMKRHLIDYELAGCGRGENYDDEHNPVAIRRDGFELIGLETEWLSPTPDAPGSRYAEQSDCPRIVTRATILPLRTAKPFYVFNTHLDHMSEGARVLGAGRVIALMRERLAKREMPLVLAGDFNAYPDSAAVRAFLTDDVLKLTDHTDGLLNSYHNYGRSAEPRIDYIMSRGFRAVSQLGVWNDERDGIYLSDHRPLSIELEME
jgi:endonuclease/exonuclease/phosphatase family metal-dependent hydrolase